jgi:hypothetical protein
VPQINKPTDYFNTVLWTGNGSTQSITGVGFQPDWVWGKERNGTTHHQVYDSVRGATKRIYTSSTAAEGTISTGLTSFDSDGFSLGSNAALNNNTNTYVGWNWLADNTSGSSNTDGSITSTVSANTTSGFSIVSYTGTGANATVGHGLGVAPKVLLIKERDNIQEWHNGFDAIGWDKYMHFNTDAQATSSLPFQSTAPTSSVFSLGASNGTNRSSGGMIAYCFAEKKGFSKFGKYTGNGNVDGTFVYLGFKPAMVILKRTDGGVANWQLNDSARDTFNVVNKRLAPSASDAEATNFNFGDFLSNGFKIRQTDQTWNISGGNYIYMAFAENPLVGTNNIPATAR